MKTFLCFALLSAVAVSHVYGGKCESRFTPWGAWSSGRNGKMEFPVPEETTSWRVDIVFDSPVNSIDAWEGTKEKCVPSKNRCSFQNEHWNSENPAGSPLSLGFQMNFDDTESHPLIKKLVFKYCTAEPCDAWTKHVVECDSTDDTDSGEEDTGDESTDEPTNPETEAPETEGPPPFPTENPETEEPDTATEDEEPSGECPFGADYPGTTVGHITHYSSSPSGNNCDLNWANLEASGLDGWTHFAALPKNPGTDADRYEAGANCGRCVKVKCSCKQELFDGACQPGGKETILMVTDSCPSCPYVGDIDTSTDGWNDLTGNEGFSKYDGTWEFIECPSNFKTGPMTLRMKGGTSKYWYAFQPENHKNKITSMEISFGGQTKEMVFGEIDGFWWKGTEIMEFPATVTMHNDQGESASVTLTGEDEVFGDNELTLDGEL